MKRALDIIISLIGLIIFSPILFICMLFVFFHDGSNPLYIANRVGINDECFSMVKLRSMVINADLSAIDSTASNDSRIIPIGKFVRHYKIDEMIQLYNVLRGDMSLVGPRPNVQNGTKLYTQVEQKLLTVRPGITDFASIVFADEGEILINEENPDLAYNQLIRPWKSRLGIIYIDNQSMSLDIKLIFWTVLSILSRNKALVRVTRELKALNVSKDIIQTSRRIDQLVPVAPPGTDEIETRI